MAPDVATDAVGGTDNLADFVGHVVVLGPSYFLFVALPPLRVFRILLR